MENVPSQSGERLQVIKGDLTDLDVDAIVYYAESDLRLGAGFGTAISVRGGPRIKAELEELGPLEVGKVALTTAGKLKAEFILHAVGPKFQESRLEEKLRVTMKNVLQTAKEKGVKSIAFPPMGTGFYGIPLELSAMVMKETIEEFLRQNSSVDKVVICLLDSRELRAFQSMFQTSRKREVA
jgi:O-acetyl-ADP-ribose deacetylase (regulator of RNase III)